MRFVQLAQEKYALDNLDDITYLSDSIYESEHS